VQDERCALGIGRGSSVLGGPVLSDGRNAEQEFAVEVGRAFGGGRTPTKEVMGEGV
jgi:hypothetical protein